MFQRFSTTANIMVNRIICLLLAVLFISLSGCGNNTTSIENVNNTSSEDYKVICSKDYTMTDVSVVNPYMGFAIDATSKKAASEYSLVYIDITFRELQPVSPDKFNFEEISQENNIDLWKSQGKHAVLRFVCDIPSDEAHMDIPDWLYDQTADGSVYDTSYGKGYSPNYSNETFIKYHKKAITALADYFSDGFVAFVELGSLGHWGEWHVKYDDGIIPMPKEAVREEYVSHYTEAFKTAKLLMRRPFKGAYDHALGLFNDMAGDSDATEEWLEWINHGGDYLQAGERDTLYAVPDFWKTAPCGGEMTSSLSMEYLCGDGLENTLELLEKSHTTFVGPKCPVSSRDIYDDALYKNAAQEIIRSLGYRIGITHVEIKSTSEVGEYAIYLEWENDGTAPLYFDLPVKLFIREDDGNLIDLDDVDIKLSNLLPNQKISTENKIKIDTNSKKDVILEIIDPMTNEPCVELVSSQEIVDKQVTLLKIRP